MKELKDRRVAFRGRLSTVAPAVLLQTLETSGKSAEVRFGTALGRGKVWFSDGRLVDARMGHHHHEAALFCLLSVTEGVFEVEYKPVSLERKIRSTVGQLVEQRSNRAKQWRELVGRAPPLDAVVVLTEGEHSLSESEAVIAGLVDGEHAVLDVIDASGIDAVEALRCIASLSEHGVLKVARVRSIPPSSKPSDPIMRAVGSLDGPDSAAFPSAASSDPMMPAAGSGERRGPSTPAPARPSPRPNTTYSVTPAEEVVVPARRRSSMPPNHQPIGSTRGSSRPPAGAGAEERRPAPSTAEASVGGAPFSSSSVTSRHREQPPGRLLNKTLRLFPGDSRADWVIPPAARVPKIEPSAGAPKAGEPVAVPPVSPGRVPEPRELAVGAGARRSPDAVPQQAVVVNDVPERAVAAREAVPPDAGASAEAARASEAVSPERASAEAAAPSDAVSPDRASAEASPPPDAMSPDRAFVEEQAPEAQDTAQEAAAPKSVDRALSGDPARFLGRYEVLCRIGRGGMGSVYLCRVTTEAGFRRLFALKVLHASLTATSDASELFLQEARLLGWLSHPNVVGVIDAAIYQGQPYLVMDYVEGCSFHELLKRSPELRSTRLVVSIVLDALAGLHAAHTLADEDGVPLEIVHCDISADNLLVGLNGVCRLSDFGIARVRESAPPSRITRGKPRYLSPEQVEGKSVDCRSDVYSMGVVLYNTLTGTQLFAGDSPDEVLAAVLQGHVPRPSEVGLRPPRCLDRICLRALKRDPAQRYQSAEAMLLELRETAIQHDLLALPSEIAAWVDQAVGEDLRMRRLACLDASRQAKQVQPRPVTPSEAPPPLPTAVPTLPPESGNPDSDHPATDVLSRTVVLSRPSKRTGRIIIAAAALALLLAVVTIGWPGLVGRLFTIDQGAYSTWSTRGEPATDPAASPSSGAPVAPRGEVRFGSPELRGAPARDPRARTVERGADTPEATPAPPSQPEGP